MLPFFYILSYGKGQAEITLDEDNSRHIVQVLRMKKAERLQLTDGQGNLLTVQIIDDHKKKCVVKVDESVSLPPRKKKVCIAISLLKNANRFEWFLEKAMEIGVSEIIPLLCERTEKQHFRQERMQALLVSAMLQSQQVWLPELRVPMPFGEIVKSAGQDRRFIAHCEEEKNGNGNQAAKKKTSLKEAAEQGTGSSLILIGPEGDFSQKEIGLALEQGFVPVGLGETRLRSETAGVVAATLLCIG
jgi:16S rRNA (uracil1498-N3)-methyltransferase